MAERAGDAMATTSDARVESALCGKNDSPQPRIRWDESALARHRKDRGVRYGTMKIDEPETPFLVYNREVSPNLLDRHASFDCTSIVDPLCLCYEPRYSQ
jgi:hypothetical protein